VILSEDSEVPQGAEQVRLVIDFDYDCLNPWYECYGPYEGRTPVFDNLRVGVIPGDPSGVGPEEGGTSAHAATRSVGIQPNPVSRSATIQFSLANPTQARIALFDAAGREVAILFDDLAAAGTHALPWSRVDESGRPLPAGVYWAQLQVPGHVLNRKLVLLRE
jgi:hypothetical protein